MGWKWFPTVAWMCDESFAINVSTKLPDDVDEKWFYFHVSWLNYTFWVVSTFVGGLFGDLLASVDLRGYWFCITRFYLLLYSLKCYLMLKVIIFEVLVLLEPL